MPTDEIPDPVRILTITCNPPDFDPEIDLGDDYDEFSALAILRICALRLEHALAFPDEEDA